MKSAGTVDKDRMLLVACLDTDRSSEVNVGARGFSMMLSFAELSINRLMADKMTATLIEVGSLGA